MLDLSVPLVCLALNIYHEARSEPLHGRLAVGLTTLNRAKHRKDKICAVVFKERQFSWTMMPELEWWNPKNKKAWNQSLKDAKTTLIIQDFTGGATHFHATKMPCPKSGKNSCLYPKWAQSLVPLGEWGAHKFYRQPKGEMK